MRSSLLSLALITFRCIFSRRFPCYYHSAVPFFSLSGLVENNIVLFLSKCKMGTGARLCIMKGQPLIGTRGIGVSMHPMHLLDDIASVQSVCPLIFTTFISVTLLPSLALAVKDKTRGCCFSSITPKSKQMCRNVSKAENLGLYCRLARGRKSKTRNSKATH